MKKQSKSGKISADRSSVKKAKKSKKQGTVLEREYHLVFAPHFLPHQGLFTDDDSLEQPSALKYVPTTSTPCAEA
jgi:hypothetical protein